ncbi:MAG TPA: glycosyltransferase family 87 protein [Polyangiaceae bacterium]|nr:glycosyltransferase family 87 protein [Polyangiaceae bacterium]
MGKPSGAVGRHGRLRAWKLPARPGLGWWAAVTLCVVAGTSLYTDLLRFENPTGEKYVTPFTPGQTDFSYPYYGALALIAGVNPYHNNHPELTNPIFRIERIDGIDFKQIYPPGHLLTYVPLALWKGVHWQEAARVWFQLNLVMLLALASIAWSLARFATQRSLSPLWVPFFFVCLALNPAEEFGLDRGQSDTLISLLCWGAVFSLLRGASGLAMFLAIWGTSIKGYPILFTAGLGLMGLARRRWRWTLAGALVGATIFVFPVARYFRDAARGIRFRSEMFWPYWFNHSFRNIAYRQSHAWADKGRFALSAFAAAVAVAACVRAWRSLCRQEPVASQAFWLVLFAAAALGTMIGYSALSVSYNLILIFPAILVLVASQERLGVDLGLPAWARHVLGAAFLGCAFLLFVCRLGNDPPGNEGNIPAAGYGLVTLFPLLAVWVVRGFLRPGLPVSDRPEPRSASTP